MRYAWVARAVGCALPVSIVMRSFAHLLSGKFYKGRTKRDNLILVLNRPIIPKNNL